MEGILLGQRGGGRPQFVDEDIVLQEREQDPTHSVLKRHGYHPFHVGAESSILSLHARNASGGPKLNKVLWRYIDESLHSI